MFIPNLILESLCLKDFSIHFPLLGVKEEKIEQKKLKKIDSINRKI